MTIMIIIMQFNLSWRSSRKDAVGLAALGEAITLTAVLRAASGRSERARDWYSWGAWIWRCEWIP